MQVLVCPAGVESKVDADTDADELATERLPRPRAGAASTRWLGLGPTNPGATKNLLQLLLGN